MGSPAVWAGTMRRLVADDTCLRRVLTARRWMSRLYFEVRYLVPDPWRLATSPYERGRAEDSIAALRDRRYAAALELGCGEGTFTARLLARCARIVAVDFSSLAVARARRRFAREPRVDVRQLDLCEGDLPGTFDLVFCAELFYYLTPAESEALAAKMLRWVSPGGDLCLVHGTSGHEAADMVALRRGASGAAVIHEPFAARSGFLCLHERSRPGYRITVLRREPGAPSRVRPDASARGGTGEPGEEPPRAVLKNAEASDPPDAQGARRGRESVHPPGGSGMRAIGFTRSDWYATVRSVLAVALGIVILARTWGYGPHLTALLVGGGFVVLGAYRLSFVVGYLRRRRST